MAKNEPLRRYFLEIEKLRQGSNPSLKEMCNYLLRKGIDKSERTIERDYEQIRKNFGISIEWNAQERGYFIDEEFSPNLPSFLRFLELANTAQLFLNGISQTKDFIKDIDFDIRGGLLGTENLHSLLEAIKSQFKIRFTHYNYLTDKYTNVLFDPYFLKEYLGRWYIVGLRDDNKIRTYGVDRISELSVSEEKFKRTKATEARANFNSIIGLVYSIGKREKVVLSFVPRQGRYVKSLPLHHSQKILIDNEKELRISLFVIPNYELFQQILMLGADVKVLEPKWLVKEIKGKLKTALNLY